MYFWYQRNIMGSWMSAMSPAPPGKPAEGTAPKVIGLRELDDAESQLTLDQIAEKYPCPTMT